MTNNSSETQGEIIKSPKPHGWRPWGDHPLVVAIAILGGILAVYGFFFADKDAVIQVKGEYLKFTIPKPFISDINKQRTKIYSQDIITAIPEDSKNRVEIANKIVDVLNKDKVVDEKNKTIYPEDLINLLKYQ
ncbi:hypothetical protein BH10ACI1_BH10ACI1_25170 [soil metagenome]